jgi:hypothetical protein
MVRWHENWLWILNNPKETRGKYCHRGIYQEEKKRRRENDWYDTGRGKNISASPMLP